MGPDKSGSDPPGESALPRCIRASADTTMTGHLSGTTDLVVCASADEMNPRGDVSEPEPQSGVGPSKALLEVGVLVIEEERVVEASDRPENFGRQRENRC